MRATNIMAVAAVISALMVLALGASTTPAPPTPSSTPQVVKQINRVNDDGSYTLGYEAADGTFKIETRDPNGNVKGMFGFLDAGGQVKRVAYATSNNNETPQGLEDLTPGADTSTTKRLRSSNIRPRSPSSLLKYRRPIPDTESPEDESPVFAMLLRRSRQGLPTRSDADELLRLQQQQHDSSDVYGSSAGSSYQVPDTPFRQHFLQGGRGRVNNAVLQHHLRQLTPDQLLELQQYASTASSQVAPEPTYAPRVPAPYTPASPGRSPMNPFLQYLAGNSIGREIYDQTYPNRYPYTPSAVSSYQYPPTQAGYYPSQTYAGYNGVTSARSYPFQNPNLPEELRQALIYRMLLAARLLGLENFISRYPPSADGLPDPRGYSYNQEQYEDPRLAYSAGRGTYLDPRQYYPRGQPGVYQAPAYYQALALARANHARQLAAYQQEQRHRQEFAADDQTVIELRRQLGDPSVQGRYLQSGQQLVYRVPVHQQDDEEGTYVTVTPSAAPSVSSTTPSSSGGSSTRAPSDRHTPSYIQRVRSVQVLNPATASPRGSASTTASSPTTRRPSLAA